MTPWDEAIMDSETFNLKKKPGKGQYIMPNTKFQVPEQSGSEEDF